MNTNKILSRQELEEFLLEIQNEAYGLDSWNLEILKVESVIPEMSLFVCHCLDQDNDNKDCLYIVRTDIKKGTFPFRSWEKFNDRYLLLHNVEYDSEKDNPVFLRISDLKHGSFSPYTKISPAPPGGKDFYFMEDTEGDLRWIDLNIFSESIYFKSMISFNEKNGVMLVEYLEQGFFMFMKGHSNSSAFREYKTFGDGTFALLIGEADFSSRENHDTAKSAEPVEEKNDTLRIFMFHTMKEYEPDK